MTVMARKHGPKEARKLDAARIFGDSLWDGSVDGTVLGCDATILFVSAEPGEGPSWHLHPYDEIFIITEGCASFTVGDEKIDATVGDLVMGPAHVPHKFHNSGSGTLRSIDIHLSREWIQTDLVDPEE